MLHAFRMLLLASDRESERDRQTKTKQKQQEFNSCWEKEELFIALWRERQSTHFADVMGFYVFNGLKFNTM